MSRWWRQAPMPRPDWRDQLDHGPYDPQLLATAIAVLLTGRTWRCWRPTR